jgi:hypothetical protein
MTTTIPLALSTRAAFEPRALRRTWILRCSRCKAHRRLDEGTLSPVMFVSGGVYPAAVCCGQEMSAKPLRGVTTDHKCGAKCTTSKGHVCECSCGGKNHGRDA